MRVLSAFFAFKCVAGTWVLSLFCNDFYACGFEVGSLKEIREGKRRAEKMREPQDTSEQCREERGREEKKRIEEKRGAERRG